jgi:DNA-nicking Smr family endonuclease
MTEDDRQVFTDAMRDVKPLERTERALPTSRPAAVARSSRAARAALIEEALNGAPVEEIAFRRPEVSETVLRQLRRGRFSIEDEIDLHGLTRADARAELKRFVLEACDRGLGCVRVIHGKGRRSGPAGPVLKALVHEWLSQWDEVLAFVSAQLTHGGNGAVYVLLRRR